MKKMMIFLLFVVVVVVSGCARIAIYDKPDSSFESKSTGIKFYTPKPYILVSRTEAKEKPIDVQVVYLPDLHHPLYAKTYSGLGSAKLSMGFSNGVMTTLGQETDPKIAELITAVGGVPGLLATAEKTRREADALKKQASDLVGPGQKLLNVARDLNTLIESESQSTKKVLTGVQIDTLKRIKEGLVSLGEEMKVPGASAQISAHVNKAEGLLKNLNDVKPSGKDLSEPEKIVWNKLAAIKSSLNEIVSDLKPKPISKPTLTLYEIIMDASGTKLREVNYLSNQGNEK